MYDDIGGGPASSVPPPLSPLETPIFDALLTEMSNYTKLSGRSTGDLDCILITYDECSLLERELGEIMYRGYPMSNLTTVDNNGQLIIRGVPLVRIDRGRMVTPEFIFVPKRRMFGESNVSIAVGLEEYNIRMETMRTSFDTAMGLTKEKVKRRSLPKTLANIRRRKLRWD